MVDEVGPVGDQPAVDDIKAGVEDHRQPVLQRQRVDQLAVHGRAGLPVTIRPPFGSCAKAVMSRSISPASRTSIGPQLDGVRLRHGLDGAELAGPGGDEGFPQHRDALHIRRDLLEQLQPFAADRIFEVGKAGDVAARPRQARDVAGADRIGDQREHDRNGAALHQQRRDGGAGMGEDDLGRERDELGRLLAQRRGVAGAEAVVDPDVLADGPARLLKPLRERGEASLDFRIVRREPISTPMRRMRVRCCACAASGQTQAAPTVAWMKSRRRMIELEHSETRSDR